MCQLLVLFIVVVTLDELFKL